MPSSSWLPPGCRRARTRRRSRRSAGRQSPGSSVLTSPRSRRAHHAEGVPEPAAVGDRTDPGPLGADSLRRDREVVERDRHAPSRARAGGRRPRSRPRRGDREPSARRRGGAAWCAAAWSRGIVPYAVRRRCAAPPSRSPRSLPPPRSPSPPAAPRASSSPRTSAGLRGRGAVRGALLGLPHAQTSRHRGLGHQRPRASTRTARTSTSARRPRRTSSTRSATAASRRARCRRTSSSARTPRRSPSSSPSTRARTSRSAGPQAPAPRAVLDLKAIRRDPEPVRAALARRRDGSDERLDGALELDAPRRAAARGRGAARAPERGLAGDRRGQAGGRGRERRDRRDAGGRAARQGARARSWRVEAELERELSDAAEPARPDRRRRGQRRCARSARRGPTGPDHLELAGAMIDMEAGARLAGSRFAYLKGDLVLVELALVRWALEVLRGHGFEPVIPPVLVREEALFGTGFLPDTEQQIYRLADDPLYLAGTSEVALASLHAGEIIEGDAAAPLRGLLAVLPARGRRRRARHARHLPRAPVRQGRDVLVRRAGGVGPSTSGCWRSRRRSCRRSSSPTAW